MIAGLIMVAAVLSIGGCSSLTTTNYPVDYIKFDCSGGEEVCAAKWCELHQGEITPTLKDRTEPDCITPTHVYEFDSAEKWYEAVGQSLHYALVSGKKPVIVLILKNPIDRKRLKRLKNVVKHYSLPIKLIAIVNSKQDKSR